MAQTSFWTGLHIWSYISPWLNMDFEGQKRAEEMFQCIILFAATLGFGIGYTFQMFSYSILTLICGTVLSCATCLLNWPWFHLKPLDWQKPRQTRTGSNER